MPKSYLAILQPSERIDKSTKVSYENNGPLAGVYCHFTAAGARTKRCHGRHHISCSNSLSMNGSNRNVYLAETHLKCELKLASQDAVTNMQNSRRTRRGSQEMPQPALSRNWLSSKTSGPSLSPLTQITLKYLICSPVIA
ncbi:General amino-acid permease GAP1 [Fusarium oxysporum f. sp. albedinis]|nr:General amino-acid permease GAP1 [Fusarium oxysporum f. sp. albedinis]